MIYRERAEISRGGVGDRLDTSARVVSIPAWSWLLVALIAVVGLLIWLFGAALTVTSQGTGVVIDDQGNTQVRAGTAGTLEKTINVIGTRVAVGQEVASIRDGSGNSIVVKAIQRGTVVGLGPRSGETVAPESYLMTLAPDTQHQAGVVFVPIASARGIAVGDEVFLTPMNVNPSVTGSVEGIVAMVGPIPADPSRVASVVADEGLAEALAENGPLIEVGVTLARNPSAPSGLTWTGDGTSAPLASGTVVEATIVTSQSSPWQTFTGTN